MATLKHTNNPSHWGQVGYNLKAVGLFPKAVESVESVCGLKPGVSPEESKSRSEKRAFVEDFLDPVRFPGYDVVTLTLFLCYPVLRSVLF